jgi:hypothetical protein
MKPSPRVIEEAAELCAIVASNGREMRDQLGCDCVECAATLVGASEDATLLACKTLRHPRVSWGSSWNEDNAEAECLLRTGEGKDSHGSL